MPIRRGAGDCHATEEQLQHNIIQHNTVQYSTVQSTHVQKLD
jgi:hypothetical protein